MNTLTINEIENAIKKVPINSVEYEPANDFYYINFNGLLGIAIEVGKNIVFDERFTLAMIKTEQLTINNKTHNFLILGTKNNDFPDNFLYICNDFISEKNREILLNEPIKWYNSWVKLLGNAKKNKMIYDVIGEMKVLVVLEKMNKKPTWLSIKEGTYDIEAEDAFYEVKSSKVKEVESIHASSINQFDTSKLNKPLNLAYCKIEDTGNGDSIQSLLNELVQLGYDENELDSYITSKGYYKNSIDRTKQYTIHEIKLFSVDENFPKITTKSFIDGKLPLSILSLEYEIGLNGLNYTKLL